MTGPAASQRAACRLTAAALLRRQGLSAAQVLARLTESDEHRRGATAASEALSAPSGPVSAASSAELGR